jgi:mono/diheme cytochrome c family protein
MICHGIAGDGKGEMSASLPVKPRSFRQGIFKYRTTPPGKLPTDADLKRTVTGGISGTAMGMFTMLDDSEVTAVIEYVKFFSRRWRQSDNYAQPIQFPPEPAWLGNAAALQDHAGRGKLLFNSACVACHGQTGNGNGIAAASLKDAWGATSAPADLHQQHLHCGSTLGDVYRVLTLGIDGTPMPSFDTFTPAQRWDIVAFIATLRVR